MQDRQFRPSSRLKVEGQRAQDKSKKSKVHSVEEAQILRSCCSRPLGSIVLQNDIGVERDEAFAKIKVKLPDIDNPNVMLKVKVDTGHRETFCLCESMEMCFQITWMKMVFRQAQN